MEGTGGSVGHVLNGLRGLMRVSSGFGTDVRGRGLMWDSTWWYGAEQGSKM
jgi:hypothetical protein